MSKFIVAGLFAITLAACGGDATGAPRGTLVLRLTDAPGYMDSVLSVNVFVVRVDARLAGSDSTAAASGAEDHNASGGGWITVARPNISVNLLQYPGGAFFSMGSRRIPPGTYNGFRLIIDPSRSNVGLQNFTVLTGLSVPNVSYSGASRLGVNIVLTEGVVVTEDQITRLLIDFDVRSSFLMRGNSIAEDGLLFNPVIRAAMSDRVR